MTLTQLQVFVAVVEAGSFTGAGEALSLTQPGVSHAIAALERGLGVRLLHRERDRATLSDAGARVLPHARELLARAEAIHQVAAGTTALRCGTVRIGSIASAARRILPEMMGAFRRAYPGIDLALVEGTDQEVEEWVRAGRVDAGVVTLPVTGLETAPLAADELLAVLPAGHTLAGQPCLRAEALAAEPFIMSTGGCEPMISAVFRAAGVTPRVSYSVRDTETLVALVEQGLGITMMPELSLPRTLPGVSVCRLDPPVRRAIALAVRGGAAVLPPAAAAFVEQAKQWTAAQG
jgi:DNA-binding transcriptional LysR family regulator